MCPWTCGQSRQVRVLNVESEEARSARVLNSAAVPMEWAMSSAVP